MKNINHIRGLKSRMFFFLLLFLPSVFGQAQVIRIACVGNSITYGAGIANRDRLSYPAQLQGWLGSQYEVRNFGVSGATLLNKGNLPYRNQKAFAASLEFKPDIVIIKLGTNDSKPVNWQYSSEFIKDYLSLISDYQNLETKPRILLALPVPVFTAEKWGIRDSVVRDHVIPMIKEVAKSSKLQYIDLYTALKPYGYAFPDEVHPNSIGASVMVEEIYRALYHRDKMHSSGYLNTAVLPAPGAECRGEAAGWGAGKDWFSQFDDIKRIDSLLKPKVVFLGNSITQGWGGEGRKVGSMAPEFWDQHFKGLNAANYGISGDRTQHILWRIQNGNFDHSKPEIVVLEIGVNNFPFHTSHEIYEGIKAIVKALQKKLPGVKILLYGPLPAGHDSKDPNRIKYREVHALIKQLENGKTLIYKNLDKQFINPDGKLVEGLMSQDAIHLSSKGYVVWGESILEGIQKLKPTNQ